jgi:hypothetical protein
MRVSIGCHMMTQPAITSVSTASVRIASGRKSVCCTPAVSSRLRAKNARPHKNVLTAP